MLLNFHGMDRPIHGMLLQIEGLFFAENEPFSNVFGPFCRISASWRGSAVDEALAKGTTVEGLVEAAVKGYIKEGDVTIEAAPGLAEALKARLAKQGEATVVTDPQMGTGFKVRLAGGRVEHDFSGDAVREALAGLLRPQLAKLLEA